MKEERKMKIKKIGIFILVILSIISVALFASCKKKNKSPDDSSSGTQQSQSEEKISLSVLSADMIFGDELNIICFYGGQNSVEWSSSDNSVAVVDDDGTVNTVGVGSCSITARAGSRNYDGIDALWGELSSGTQGPAYFG